MAADTSPTTAARTARPDAVGSLGAFWPLIEPVLDALAPRALCEVGVESGAFAARLLAWCGAHGCRYFGIDPVQVRDPDFLRNVDASSGKFIQGRSLETLPTLEACGAYFLDGDHNFFTVRGELAAIAERARGLHPGEGPIIFLHDVCWPWGRRDMYYAPETIPNEGRHAFSDTLGTTPAGDELVDGGMRAAGVYAIATRAGGARNGVLTAVEAFLADTAAGAGVHWEMVMLPVAYGLAVLFQPDTLPPACRQQLEELRGAAARMHEFHQTLESNYLEIFLFSRSIETAYRGLQAYADGMEKSYRGLEVAYRDLLAHADRLLKDYHLLEDYRQGLEAANARLRADAAAVTADPEAGRAP
jgi:hypothetical protein